MRCASSFVDGHFPPSLPSLPYAPFLRALLSMTLSLSPLSPLSLFPFAVPSLLLLYLLYPLTHCLPLSLVASLRPPLPLLHSRCPLRHPPVAPPRTLVSLSLASSAYSVSWRALSRLASASPTTRLYSAWASPVWLARVSLALAMAVLKTSFVDVRSSAASFFSLPRSSLHFS